MLNITVILFTISFSVYKSPESQKILIFKPTSISTTNILIEGNYATDPITVKEGSTLPYEIDIAPYQSAEDFIAFLKTIPLPVNRFLEVQQRAISFKG